MKSFIKICFNCCPFLLLLVVFLFHPVVSFAGTKILDYGFEDWSGDANTTPGYIFTISDSTVWQKQLDSTEVLSSCGGRSAHSGTYFFRKRMDDGTDTCLGTTATENSYVRFGNNATAYPTSGGSTVDFSTDISSETMTVRFYMRLTGYWPPTGVEDNPFAKFMRMCVGASDYEADDRCSRLNLNADGTHWNIFDYGTVDTDYFTGPDMDDGNWHSISVVFKRLNNTVTSPNYHLEFWVDDWDMSGSSVGAKNMYVVNPGSAAFRMIALWVNYGSYPVPTQEHAIEFDDFEVWDGTPNSVTIIAPHQNPAQNILD